MSLFNQPSIPVTYIAQDEVTSPKFGLAFAEGCDGPVFDEFKLPTGDFAMFGSPQYIDLVFHARRNNLNFYYGDHAYFKRFLYYRCTKNALQHSGDGNEDPTRFNKLGVPILDWKQKRGDKILLCPNSEMFYTFWSTTQKDWLDSTIEELRKYTDRPIIMKQKTDSKKLEHYFPQTWAVVVYTSNSAVDAAMAGIPAFATEQCAGLLVGSKDLSLIENPPMPDDRERVAAVLANNQWTLEELRRGDCWEIVRGTT